MDRNFTYLDKNMKVAPEYREESGLTVAILKDSTGHYSMVKGSLAEMHRSLEMDLSGANKPKVLAIYPNTNLSARGVIRETYRSLNMGKEISLEDLLKYKFIN